MSASPPPIPPVRANGGLSDRESLESLLDRLDQLARRSVTPDQFFEELTAGVLSALPAEWTVVWGDAAGGVQCLSRRYRSRPDDDVSPVDSANERSAVLLALQRETPLSLPPAPAATNNATADSASMATLATNDTVTSSANAAASPLANADNQTRFLQLFVPVKGDSVSGLVLQVALPPNVSLSMRETATSLLQALAEVALTFRVNDRLRSLTAREQFWLEIDSALLAMHQNRDRTQTALTIAEECRRLAGADRVSVLQCHGRRFRLLATSARVTVNRRSRQVKLLEQLAAQTMQSGRSLDCVVGRDGPQSPARLAMVAPALDPYLDLTDTRAVWCVPLYAAAESASNGDGNLPSGSSESAARVSAARASIGSLPFGVRPAGMLIVEAFSVDHIADWEERVPLLARHSGQALGHAIDWQRTGWRRLFWPFQKLSRALLTVLIFAAIGGAVAALSLIQTDFTIEAEGQLLPTQSRGIFAPSDAIVTEIRVSDEAEVQAGETLVVLENPTLEQEWSRLQGEVQTVAAKLESVQARRSVRTRDRELEAQNLAAEESELKKIFEGLTPELELLKKQRAALTLTSPIQGQVSGWELKQVLQSRPVQHGQRLMQVYDPDGPWRLELRVPHDVVGYVREAQSQSEKPKASRGQTGAAAVTEQETADPRTAVDQVGLPVDFLFQADANHNWTQRLSSLDPSTELDAQGKLSVRATVDIPPGLFTDPQHGATVLARIHCGKRALGFVWFREISDYVRKRVLF